MGDQFAPVIVALILVAAASIPGANSRHDPNVLRGRPGCSYERAHGLYIAVCAELDLTEVPVLRTDISALDLTRNRIREIALDTFERYPKLRVLYMGDNSISEDVAYALTPLQNLEILDLSLNNLRTLPIEILQLPSLRKLYISQNKLNQIPPDFLITSPTLQLLWMSDCKLRSLNLGDLPQLLNLNVSNNPLLPQLRLSEIARMCRLQTLDTSGNSEQLPEGEDPLDMCRCPIENMWRSLRQQLNMSKRPCEDWLADAACAMNSTDVAEAAFELNADCVEAARREMQASTRTWWAVIGGSIIATVAIAVAFLAWRGRREKAITTRPPMPQQGAKEAAPLSNC